MANTIQKHIYIPLQLAQLGEEKARRFGYTLTKYMEYLLAKDVEGGVEMLNVKTLNSLKKAINDVKKGRLGRTLKTKKDIDNYFS
ncbi:hypothetical protein ACFLY9_00690 [Patescibacteria group bacterium]